MRPTRLVPLVALLSAACSKPETSPAPSTPSKPATPVEAEGRPPAEGANTSQAQAELDHTIWDCGWSILVFWDDNLHWVHRDVALAAMGGEGLFAREDHDVDYGSDRTFKASLRYREYPQGQRGPESFKAARPRKHAYTIEGDVLHLDPSEEDALECGRGCYDQAFIDFMDARYGTSTSAEAISDKMAVAGCG